MMRVIGFDPGTATTGYGVVEESGNRVFHLEHGVIRTPAGMHFAERLRLLSRECTELIARIAPDAIAIEKLFFKKNVTTGIGVAQARGVIALAAAEYGARIGEFGPSEVKLAVTSNGRAAKAQVQQMIKIILNLDTIPKPDDAADGLAIALCQVYSGARSQLLENLENQAG